MKATIGWFVGLVLSVSVSAEPLLEGRVRLESGEPVADAQVRIFDLSDRRQGAIARALTDGTGQFALPLASLTGRALPEQFALGPNYPNPFNPSTTIPYQLAASAQVRLEVFNLLGQHIATLVEEERPAGFHTATWHAVDGAGRAAGAGIYIYRMTVGVESQTGRMVLLDGQAGVSAAGATSVWSSASGVGGSDGEGAQVYGLVVSGSGLVPYVDSAFRVESGMAPVELVVSEGPHSAGKATDDDCALCDLFGQFEGTEGPDLIVQSPSVSDSVLTPKQAFTLHATVHNQGNEQAAATMLHYYRSNNATVNTSDTKVGTDSIDVLDASATSAVSISLTAPSIPGPYYYGACVDRKSGERAGNNCSAGIRVIVENWVPSRVPSNGGSVTSITGLPGKTILTAYPNPGYDFQQWTKGGETLSTDTTHVAEAADVQRILAHFSVNRDRGKWNVGQTYSHYTFPEGEYESLEWTFMSVVDPPESLSQEGLLHYYAHQFYLVNSTKEIGLGYAGFQSNGLFRKELQGKVINYAIWGANGGKTDGLLEPNNPESGGYRIMYPFEWIEGQAYRFELREGPSELDARGKWWGLWVEDVATGSVTFVGELRMQTEINGRDAKMLSSHTTVFGEDLHWWRTSKRRYICSDFQPSSLVVSDVTADANRAQPQVSYEVNSGEGYTWPNGRKTTNCHVTMFVNEQGDVQHNLGFWPEPPPNVVD